MTKRDQIAALVGEEAVDLTLRANKWMMRAISAAVPIPILAVLSSALHVPQLWILIPICVITTIGMSVSGARLDNHVGDRQPTRRADSLAPTSRAMKGFP